MSCYSKHPDVPDIECWHGPGHAGDHGKENRRWPNLDDPVQAELAALRKVASDARWLLLSSSEIPDGGLEATDALEASLKAAGR